MMIIFSILNPIFVVIDGAKAYEGRSPFILLLWYVLHIGLEYQMPITYKLT